MYIYAHAPFKLMHTIPLRIYSTCTCSPGFSTFMAVAPGVPRLEQGLLLIKVPCPVGVCTSLEFSEPRSRPRSEDKLLSLRWRGREGRRDGEMEYRTDNNIDST